MTVELVELTHTVIIFQQKLFKVFIYLYIVVFILTGRVHFPLQGLTLHTRAHGIHRKQYMHVVDMMRKTKADELRFTIAQHY